jgi:hypothetical protein
MRPMCQKIVDRLLTQRSKRRTSRAAGFARAEDVAHHGGVARNPVIVTSSEVYQ